MSATKIPNRSAFVIRPALKTDYDDVMAISHGIYGGRDIMPAIYSDYLDDPNRVFYVAVDKNTGKVVSLAGARIIDNGETFEGEGARTDSRLRGTNLYINRALRARLLEEGVVPNFPRLRRMRVLSMNVAAFTKNPQFSAVPYGLRNVMEIIWEMPKITFKERIAALPENISFQILPFERIMKASAQDLEYLFKHDASQRHLFPSGVIVRDSQSFLVGVNYRSNIPLLLGDRLHAVFVTRSPDTSLLTSMSFGTGIESGVSLKTMRYCIDYYGDPDMDKVKCHVAKHLLEIQECLHKSSTAELVCSHVFMPHHVIKEINGDELVKFVANDLKFGVIPRYYAEQCLIQNSIPFKEFLAEEAKL